MGDANKKTEEGINPQNQELSGSQGEQGSGPSEVEKLRQELEVKELEAKQNYDRFLRQVAELENFKKRTAREKEETIKYANENLIKDLLPILDNLERAVDYAKGGGDGRPLLDGIDMVLKGFIDVLNKYGVTQISAIGQTFDPKKHEAIARVQSEKGEPNTVIEEHHKGYYLLDRLLRPSLVSVAKPSEAGEGKRKEGEVEKGDKDD
jgi:molecular chaperone GrpE